MDKKTFTLILFSLTLTFSVNAAIINEERLPAYLLSQKAHLKRCSTGKLKAFQFFHVGYAALYLEKCQRSITIFQKSPKWLRFAYDRDIPAHAFREASEEYLKNNLGEDFLRWRQVITTFNEGYRDINEGDYYDLVYSPETGLKLNLNGNELAVMDDPEIGLAYFNIWFGAEPFSSKLKNELLTADDVQR